ncbi:unnamed protein product [Cyprideis torosa]|uniref:Uncharacterized protein n=1 Tax=Cyprideis torosa TaxID=163714 RepID=A0A7R8W933_9CRUS|nr:unnamed protein product [Cyprideis torosa]CAG0884947.1 unnamed protein product [Cyprideis torosa]
MQPLFVVEITTTAVEGNEVEVESQVVLESRPILTSPIVSAPPSASALVAGPEENEVEVLATKTFFTTFTYLSTFLNDQSETVIETSVAVSSSVVVEPYSVQDETFLESLRTQLLEDGDTEETSPNQTGPPDELESSFDMSDPIYYRIGPDTYALRAEDDEDQTSPPDPNAIITITTAAPPETVWVVDGSPPSPNEVASVSLVQRATELPDRDGELMPFEEGDYVIVWSGKKGGEFIAAEPAIRSGDPPETTTTPSNETTERILLLPPSPPKKHDVASPPLSDNTRPHLTLSVADPNRVAGVDGGGSLFGNVASGLLNLGAVAGAIAAGAQGAQALSNMNQALSGISIRPMVDSVVNFFTGGDDEDGSFEDFGAGGGGGGLRGGAFFEEDRRQVRRNDSRRRRPPVNGRRPPPQQTLQPPPPQRRPPIRPPQILRPRPPPSLPDRRIPSLRERPTRLRPQPQPGPVLIPLPKPTSEVQIRPGELVVARPPATSSGLGQNVVFGSPLNEERIRPGGVSFSVESGPASEPQQEDAPLLRTFQPQREDAPPVRTFQPQQEDAPPIRAFQPQQEEQAPPRVFFEEPDSIDQATAVKVVSGEGAIFFGGVDPDDLPPPGAPITALPISPSAEEQDNIVEQQILPSRTQDRTEPSSRRPLFGPRLPPPGIRAPQRDGFVVSPPPLDERRQQVQWPNVQTILSIEGDNKIVATHVTTHNSDLVQHPVVLPTRGVGRPSTNLFTRRPPTLPPAPTTEEEEEEEGALEEVEEETKESVVTTSTEGPLSPLEALRRGTRRPFIPNRRTSTTRPVINIAGFGRLPIGGPPPARRTTTSLPSRPSTSSPSTTPQPSDATVTDTVTEVRLESSQETRVREGGAIMVKIPEAVTETVVGPGTTETKYITRTETVTRSITATETRIFHVQGRPITKTEVIVTTVAPRTAISTVIGSHTEINYLPDESSISEDSNDVSDNFYEVRAQEDTPKPTPAQSEEEEFLKDLLASKPPTPFTVVSQDDPRNSPIAIDFDNEIRRGVEETNEINRVIGAGSPEQKLSVEQPRAPTACHPKCKDARSELCQQNPSDGSWGCICKPGFARPNPDAPCQPTLSYRVVVPLTHVDQIPLEFNAAFRDSTSPEFAQLALMSRDGLDRAFGSSPLDTHYHGSRVLGFNRMGSSGGVMAEFITQVSPRSLADEGMLQKHLTDVVKAANFSLGGTVLKTLPDLLTEFFVEDLDECRSSEYHDCSEFALCLNKPGTFTCVCQDGYLDLSSDGDLDLRPGRVCSAAAPSCGHCSYHGECVARPDGGTICKCQPWFSGARCQLNMKVLLIVLVTIGSLLVLGLCLGMFLFCSRKRRSHPHQRPPPFLFASPIDRHAMIVDTSSSSESSLEPRPAHFAPAYLTQLPPPASVGRVSQKSRRSEVTYDGDRSLPATSAAPPVMIPRAKYSTTGTSRRSSVSVGADGRSDLASTERSLARVLKGKPTGTNKKSSKASSRRSSIEGRLGPHRTGSDYARSNDRLSVARSYDETTVADMARPGPGSVISSRCGLSEDGRTAADRDDASSVWVPQSRMYKLAPDSDIASDASSLTRE